MNKLAYPLDWPNGWNRTEARHRKEARYVVTQDKAQKDLMQELIRLDPINADMAVISTNIPVRKSDGLPYAKGPRVDDPGVAVYFYRAGNHHVIACDCWSEVRYNMRAIGLTVEALRAIDRAGSTGILDRAYSGFTALDAPPKRRTWRDVLGYRGDNLAECEAQYKKRRGAVHPDREDGDSEEFVAVMAAWEQAQKALGGPHASE